MSVSPRDAVPPVPAGKVRLAEAGSVPHELFAERTVLARATGALPQYPEVRLQYSTRGYVCAGSVQRWDEARWSVLYEPGDGTIQGRSFCDTPEGEAEARALFAKWTDYEAVSRKRQEDAWLEETVYAPARAERAAEQAARLAAEKERKAALRRYRAAQRRAGAAA